MHGHGLFRRHEEELVTAPMRPDSDAVYSYAAREVTGRRRRLVVRTQPPIG